MTVRSAGFEMSYEVDQDKASPELVQKFEDMHEIVVKHFDLAKPEDPSG